jgi:hypothetical protein
MNKRITAGDDYQNLHSNIVALVETAHSAAARNVNALMTASYWTIGHRIMELSKRDKIGQLMARSL